MHTEIIDLGVKLGYFKDRLGACKGVTMAWLSACLTSKEQAENYSRFTEKITKDGDNLFVSIKKIREKASQGETLSKEEVDLFQYIAFYEQIALYLQPYAYTQVFGRRYNQNDVKLFQNMLIQQLLKRKEA